MRTKHKLCSVLAAIVLVPNLAQASQCEAGSDCMQRCQQKLGYCMTIAGLNQDKIAACQIDEGNCQIERCECQKPELPLRTSVIDRCFTSCRNSVYECGGADPTDTTISNECRPMWLTCMATCVPTQDRILEPLPMNISTNVSRSANSVARMRNKQINKSLAGKEASNALAMAHHARQAPANHPLADCHIKCDQEYASCKPSFAGNLLCWQNLMACYIRCDDPVFGPRVPATGQDTDVQRPDQKCGVVNASTPTATPLPPQRDLTHCHIGCNEQLNACKKKFPILQTSCYSVLNKCFAICDGGNDNAAHLPEPTSADAPVSRAATETTSANGSSRNPSPSPMPAAQKLWICHIRCDRVYKACQPFQSGSCFHELRGCYKRCDDPVYRPQLPAAATASKQTRRSEYVTSHEQGRHQTREVEAFQLSGKTSHLKTRAEAPAICQIRCESERTLCYAGGHLGESCHLRMLECIQRCHPIAENPSEITTREILRVTDDSHEDKGNAMTRTDLLTEENLTLDVGQWRKRLRTMCYRRCQEEQLPCFWRYGNDRYCRRIFRSCRDLCDRTTPLHEMLAIDAEVPPDQKSNATHSLEKREDDPTCLLKCEARRNTCDTIVPVRQNCGQQYAICRHSCSHAVERSELQLLAPDTRSTQVASSDIEATSIKEGSQTIPTNKPSCVAGCRAREETCQGSGKPPDQCRRERRRCDQSCYHSASTEQDHHAIGARNHVFKDRNTEGQSAPEHHHTFGSSSSSDRCPEDCAIEYKQCVQDHPQHKCEKTREKCVAKCASRSVTKKDCSRR